MQKRDWRLQGGVRGRCSLASSDGSLPNYLWSWVLVMDSSQEDFSDWAESSKTKRVVEMTNSSKNNLFSIKNKTKNPKKHNTYKTTFYYLFILLGANKLCLPLISSHGPPFIIYALVSLTNARALNMSHASASTSACPSAACPLCLLPPVSPADLT